MSGDGRSPGGTPDCDVRLQIVKTVLDDERRLSQQLHAGTAAAGGAHGVRPQLFYVGGHARHGSNRTPINLWPKARRAKRSYKIIVREVVRFLGFTQSHQVQQVRLEALSLPTGYYLASEGERIILRKEDVAASKPRSLLVRVHSAPFFQRMFAYTHGVQPSEASKNTTVIARQDDGARLKDRSAQVEQRSGQNLGIDFDRPMHTHYFCSIGLVGTADVARSPAAAPDGRLSVAIPRAA
ncbi:MULTISPECIES: hypothetical protein [unclassified Methylobacterium]|uniref:hypothetical protein n=1 Tax=unclassified Methylobacterium TaxID=2615210 RepID=UPI001FBB3162|nr:MULTISPECIES: hypothetical protein [unclassified Methylobacterium]MCJ2093952.1 hypothetical protein [Methylobacterium sp. J-072]MCJ2142932.1 hypothetical protein [Methylobacterium sp. E-066]